ncbi:MAG: endo-1,4-beta-xylanase Z [Bacteroidales bacterium]|nr:endo-1,4-beta-xylanase Z [Bacteroidales bacterium]
MRGVNKISLVISTMVAAFLCTDLSAQERVTSPNDTIVPVRKLSNGNVLFSVYAPKARTIELKGDVANYNNKITTREGSDGVWTFEVTNVPEGALRYYYVIDGVATMEPTASKPEIQKNVYSLDTPGSFYAFDKDIPHGVVSVMKYNSTVDGKARTAHIWIPAGYQKAKTKLPVLYLLHGHGDDDSSWIASGEADNILDKLFAEGKMEPMLVVMPNGDLGEVDDMFICGPKVVEDFVNVVIPQVESTFNVYTDPSHRAIAGLSMGGWETLDMLSQHYDMFSYVWVLSSGWFADIKEKYDYEAAHLKEIASKVNKQLNQRVFTQGAPEGVAYENGLKTTALCKDAGIKYEFYSAPGGHTWYTWRNNLHALAQRLFK